MAIYEACNDNEEAAARFFGNVWKKAIIERKELWIGYRPDPTFPKRGIALDGKSYFPDGRPKHTASSRRSSRSVNSRMGTRRLCLHRLRAHH